MTGRPASTYRLQLTPSFGFREAAAVLPYLDELGITHVYLSPIFESTPGSSHGYDVIDHNRLRGELGGDAGWQELVAAARARGLGIVIDFVPNHMGINQHNVWWYDVLENGPSSVHAPVFDIDWHPVKDELHNRVLVPILGDFFGAVLERGELRLARDGGAFVLEYFDHRFPVAPRAVPLILRHRLPVLVSELGEGDLHLQEMLSIATSLEKLAPRQDVEPDKVAERAREKEVAKRRLDAVLKASPAICKFVDDNVTELNGRVEDPRSFDLLDALLDHQAYRLAHWRVAGDEINYRRFFDVNTLAAIRMEDERVFEATHRLLLDLVARGEVHAIRIDHPDGLYQPTAYFEKLRRAVGPDVPVLVEKILEGPEKMPRSWAVDGTTGYEFLNALNGLFVDGRGARPFDVVYWRFVGRRVHWDELVYASKKQIMRSSMGSEMAVLAHRLNRISEMDRKTRDFTLNVLHRALVEYVACLPIYRTYVEGTLPRDVDARDRGYIVSTIARAQKRDHGISGSVFAFLQKVLLLEDGGDGERVEFVRKLQQVTGPVTAKALEDTAFYVYGRLISLNEVGGDPERFGVEPQAFHRLNLERLRDWPLSLAATSTHDTKRSEDVRLRIDALSEIPRAWLSAVRRWSRMNRPFKTVVDGALAPDRNDEMFLYQTLIGAFPDDERVDDEFVARILAYLEKSLKEAKVHTTWTNPNDAYDRAAKGFAESILRSNAWVGDFVGFWRPIARVGRVTTLAQVALKVVSPGVTDVYQGTDLVDLSLVDPDNRRAVDFGLRAEMLRNGNGEGDPPRAAKLMLLQKALRFRREKVELFLEGEYQPLLVEGRDAGRIVAAARRWQGDVAVCVAPRLLLGKPEGEAWDGRVRLADVRELECVVSGRAIEVVDGQITLEAAFAGFPVLLARGR